METHTIIFAIYLITLIPLLCMAGQREKSHAIILIGILLSPVLGWIAYALMPPKNTNTARQQNPTQLHPQKADPLEQWELAQRIKQGPPPPPAHLQAQNPEQ